MRTTSRTSRKVEAAFASTVALALSGLLGAGCHRADEAARASKEQPPLKVEVGVFEVKAQPAQLSTELPGRTSAFLIADVRPQVAGVLTKRIFTEGADVKEGQQLYQIDPALYQAAYDTAVASLAHAEAALASAQAKTARFEPLAAARAVSKQDFDDSKAAAGEAVADVATAKASIEQARINLAYTKVYAPISGRIGRSAVTPGALVTAGQTTPLATITQLDPIYVDVTESATTLLRLRQELKEGKLRSPAAGEANVDLMLENGSKYGAPGRLQFSEVNVDQTTGTVVLRALFPNPDKLLLPGLYVRAVLQEGTDDKAIVIPQQAVSHNAHGDPTALVVAPDGTAQLRTIVTSRALGDKWVVSSGLADGEKVIVDGLQNVKPGTPVQPTAGK